jgi:hypothetical protein
MEPPCPHFPTPPVEVTKFDSGIGGNINHVPRFDGYHMMEVGNLVVPLQHLSHDREGHRFSVHHILAVEMKLTGTKIIQAQKPSVGMDSKRIGHELEKKMNMEIPTSSFKRFNAMNQITVTRSRFSCFK